MDFNIPFLNDFPKSVKNAWLLMIGAWGGLFLFLYLFFSVSGEGVPKDVLYKLLVIVGVLGYFFYQAKKWVRPLCILCNSLIMLLFTWFFILIMFYPQHILGPQHAGTRYALSALSIAVIAFFGAASYLLLGREAKAFFAGAQKTAPNGP